MAQIELRPCATDSAVGPRSSRRFVTRFIVSSFSSATGLVSFVMTGPVMCRVAAIDPALEPFYLALVFGWFWALARMWLLTLEAPGSPVKQRQPQNQILIERRCSHATQSRKDVRI